MTLAFDNALKMLETFSEIGLTLTVAEPNDYMCRIGAKIGDVDQQTARRIYRFMIDAALDEYIDGSQSDLIDNQTENVKHGGIIRFD